MDHENFIQQIIPAPPDCHAVFGVKHDNEIEIRFERVPCFALSIDCVDADKEMNHDHTCKPDRSRPQIEPCVLGEWGAFHVRVSEHRAPDTHYLGLNYGDVKPDKWMESARMTFEGDEVEAEE